MRKLAVALALLCGGCAFTRIRYPSISDRQANIWVCAPDPGEANGIVCWDAAVVFHEAMEAHRRSEGTSL